MSDNKEDLLSSEDRAADAESEDPSPKGPDLAQSDAPPAEPPAAAEPSKDRADGKDSGPPPRGRSRKRRTTRATKPRRAVEPAPATELASDEDVDDADLKRRRVRRRRRITAPASRIAAAPRDDAGGEPEARPARRRRRSRRATAPPQATVPDEGSRPPRRMPPPRDEQPGKRPVSGSAPKRKVYRQDLPPDHPSRKPKPPPPEKSAAAKQAETNKITLILHPAPKATPKRKKKSTKALTAKEALKAKARKRQSPAAAKDEAAKPRPAAELSEHWLAASEPEQVTAAVNEAGEHASELIKAWQDGSNAEAIALVARTESLPSSARKAARRALNVLKSRGVEIPEGPEPTPATKDKRQPEIYATFVPPDSSGTSFLSITVRESGGRYRVADAVIHDVAGITHANTARLAGKQIRKWQRRMTERFGAAPVDVPVDWARYEIDVARRRNAQSKYVLPMGLDACMALFEPVPEEEPAHPLAELDKDFTTPEIEKASADSERLHAEPEFRAWYPDQPALDELLQKVGARVGAEGASNQQLVEDTLQEEVAAATDRFFTPERRQQLSNRMKDSAISVRSRAGDDLTRQIMAVAKGVREAGLVTSPPREMPFLLAFFKKGIALMLQQGAGKLQVPVPKQ